MDALLVVGIIALVIGLIGAAPGIEVVAKWIQAFAPRLVSVTNSLLGFLSGLTKITMSRKQFTGLWLIVAIAGVVLAGIALTSGSGENGPPPTPTPTRTVVRPPPSPTSAVATATPAATPTTGQEALSPTLWLTLPNVPPGSWSSSTPRGMNVYQTSFASWEDDRIRSWLTDPQSMLGNGEYHRYLIKGASEDAPEGAKVSVSVTVRDPDSLVPIRWDVDTVAIQEDGTWEAKTQVFPNDIGRSTYTLRMEIRSADRQLLLRAVLTIGA